MEKTRVAPDGLDHRANRMADLGNARQFPIGFLELIKLHRQITWPGGLEIIPAAAVGLLPAPEPLLVALVETKVLDLLHRMSPAIIERIAGQ